EEKPKQSTTQKSTSTKSSPVYKQANSYPRISGNTTKANQPNQITVNELDGVQAASTTSQSRFADEIGMKEKKFRKLNDMEEGERIETGKYYYTEKKKTSAEVETHVVQPGETLWTISQKYGIRLSSLKSKNRIRKDSDLKPGMVLNLQEPRKRGEEIPRVQVSPATETQRTVIAQNEPDPTPAQVETTSKTEEKKYTPSSSYHTVSQGETLYSISKRYGVTVDQLKTWNKIGSQNIISIGQKLVIFTP
ncbi:MAG: LysM peptidoglycan-binding domain-containing protein, partial [Cyclobacteriaceae bacterium]|nr:LysM peptidoglycan-binding domain-containing protein [Cyclobacteriaceae bacterium]